MMNSYYIECHSRRRKDHPSRKEGNNELHSTISRTSFASFGRKSREPLSKQVWDRNHHFDSSPNNFIPTPPQTRSSTKLLDHGTTASGRQSSYELELLNRRLNILGEGLLDSGGDPWTPIEVIVTPASSDFVGPESSEDSSLEFPVTPGRRRFVSLRGLFGSHSSSANIVSKVGVAREELASVCKNNNGFLKTAEEEKSEASNTKNMADVEVTIGSKAHVVPSPWESKSEEEEKSRDKGTSPYQEEGNGPGTEIRVFQNQTKGKYHRHVSHPQYPFETGTSSKGQKLNRPTIHNGLLRSHRLHDYSQPSVVSSTQQLLCLTPSRGGVITLGSKEDIKNLVKPMEGNKAVVQVKRFNENDNSTQPMTVVTKTSAKDKNTFFRLMQRDTSSRPRTSAAYGHPFNFNNLHYKHVTQIRKSYRYPALSPTVNPVKKSNSNVSKTPTFERNATAMSMTKHTPSTAYRIIESHLKWNRKLPVFQDEVVNVYPYQPSFNVRSSATQARKMAPVLRVLPAFPKTASPPVPKKAPKSPVDTEPASQKKVRFSDQIGLPLVRNATPNYRRKHSYILRWLETAGRPAKAIPLV